jgi:hypothetical protein
LSRQSERYRREGIDLSLSTLADQVGACTTALQPLYGLIERHVAAERLHGDDTTVPILAKGKTVKGRIWTYVRDDRPFRGNRSSQTCEPTAARLAVPPQQSSPPAVFTGFQLPITWVAWVRPPIAKILNRKNRL